MDTFPKQSKGTGQATARVEMKTADMLTYLPIRQVKSMSSTNPSPITVIIEIDPAAIIEGLAFNILGTGALVSASTAAEDEYSLKTELSGAFALICNEAGSLLETKTV
jgi:hypothetical protein